MNRGHWAILLVEGWFCLAYISEVFVVHSLEGELNAQEHPVCAQAFLACTSSAGGPGILWFDS